MDSYTCCKCDATYSDQYDYLDHIESFHIYDPAPVVKDIDIEEPVIEMWTRRTLAVAFCVLVFLFMFGLL